MVEVKTERRAGAGRQQPCALQRYYYQNFRDTKKKNHRRKISVEIQGETNLCKVTERAN